MPSLSLRVLSVALVFVGCSVAPQLVRCASDDDCSSGQVCFANGCGDPNTNLVAEIEGDAVAGQFAQDVAIESLKANQTFTIQSPLTVAGEFQRERTANVDPTNRVAYTEPVTVQAIGESELIPGVTRSYQAKFAQPERGLFNLNVGAGTYQIVAAAEDRSVPPELKTGIVVRPGSNPTVAFAFTALQGAVTLQGRLLRKRTVTVPPMDLPVTDAPMDIQVIDPITRQPLSQRVEVSSGLPGSTGDFSVTMSPRVKTLTALSVIASPRRAGSMVPTKVFSVPYPLPSEVVLELGDYGTVQQGVSATVLGPDGRPVANAQVVIEGKVGGEGEFRSSVATTNAEGVFHLDLLSSEIPFLATVVPPPGSLAAAWQGSVRVEAFKLSPATINCSARINVTGALTNPSGTAPVGGAAIRATHQAAVSSAQALPYDDVQGVTEPDGTFALHLDPGTWRLEFIPALQAELVTAPADGGVMPEELPRMSRTIELKALTNSGAVTTDIALDTYALPKGRRITGQVMADSAKGATAVPFASVRFFRVADVGGTRAAMLLSTAVADSKGNYSVVLPSR